MKKYLFVLAFLVAVAGLSLLIDGRSATAGTADGRVYDYKFVDSTLASSTNFTVLKTRPGVLGSIVVSSSTNGDLYVYNATSSTSTASVITRFTSNSTSHGTYTYDAVFTTGLIIEPRAGFNGEVTIMYE